MDALDGIGQPHLREIVLFARSRRRPVTADEVAARFRVHRSVARSRLDRLAGAGLLTVGFERRTGRSGPGAGRPAKVYGVPPETTALEFPERHYDRLVGHLVDALPEDDRDAALAQVGARFAQGLAAEAGVGRAPSVEAAAERACEALRALGFQAAVVEASGQRATITTPNCPLRPVVVANPGAVAVDRGMWTQLLCEHLGPEALCTVACETHDCLDGRASCRVVLDFQGPGGRST